MKIHPLILSAAWIVAACNNPSTPSQKTSGDSTQETRIEEPVEENSQPVSGRYCFLRTEGEDTTSVELLIDGEKVAGTMNWLPFEKDSRKGSLSGTLRHGIIKANWKYMQEGMENTLPVEFQWQDEQLKQKKSRFDLQTGQESLDERSGYELLYRKHACQ